jgi:hypothetical protein
MVTNVFMRLVNAVEKSWSQGKRVNENRCAGMGRLRVNPA